MSIVDINKIFKNKSYFINYVNAGSFLSGIVVVDVTPNGIHTVAIEFDNTLSLSQLDDLSIHLDSYTEPPYIINTKLISAEQVSCNSTTYFTTHTFSYSGTNNEKKMNDISFDGFIESGVNGTFDIRIWDNTNQAVLGELTNLNNTVTQTHFIELNNIPKEYSQINIQCLTDAVTTTIKLVNFQIIYYL